MNQKHSTAFLTLFIQKSTKGLMNCVLTKMVFVLLRLSLLAQLIFKSEKA